MNRFLTDMSAQLAGQHAPREQLREALAKDELKLYCQPIAALSGAVRFPIAEVPVRMRSEEEALLPPGDFLPAFDQFGLMTDLDGWVVREVIGHLSRGSRMSRFSINVSGQSLADDTFPQTVATELVSSGVPGTALLFEVSEADCLARLESALRFGKAIRAGYVQGFGVTHPHPLEILAVR